MVLTKKDERFLKMASGVALTSKCRFKHGAVVVRHGKVLASSPNLNKNNPLHVSHEHCSIHAEVRALRKARYPKRATIYVSRVNGQGEERLSKPCNDCMSLIEDLRCKVFWT